MGNVFLLIKELTEELRFRFISIGYTS